MGTAIAGAAGATGAAKTGAAGKGAAGTGKTAGAGTATFSAELGEPAAAFTELPDMMRVNSPGSETPTGAGATDGIGEEAADDCRSSVNLWINMVMLLGAFATGTTGCGLCSPKRLAGGSFSGESARNNWVTPAASMASLAGGESRFEDHAASVPLFNGVNGRTGAAGAGAGV